MTGRARVAVVTIVHGRHVHLRRHLEAIDAMRTPVDHVVVAMGDAAVADIVERVTPDRSGPGGPRPAVRRQVVDVDLAAHDELPLGHARNVGATVALRRRAELLIFLDVDCLPAAGLVDDYLAAVRDAGTRPGPVLWCGEVAYLPPLPAGVRDYPLADLDAWAPPHPARPQLAPGTHRFSSDMRMFWSLNFAVSAPDWVRSEGFHPGYVGYSCEDTDLAMAAGAAGGELGWIGGARAFHQHHPTSTPPWQHLAAIVRNALVFRARWGWFPMEGWLSAFADAGAVDFRPGEGVLRLTDRAALR